MTFGETKTRHDPQDKSSGNGVTVLGDYAVGEFLTQTTAPNTMEEATGAREIQLSSTTMAEVSTRMINSFSINDCSGNARRRKGLDVERHELFVKEELDTHSSAYSTAKLVVMTQMSEVENSMHDEFPRSDQKGIVLSDEEVRNKGHELFDIDELDPLPSPTLTANFHAKKAVEDSEKDMPNESLLSNTYMSADDTVKANNHKISNLKDIDPVSHTTLPAAPKGNLEMHDESSPNLGKHY